MARFLRPGISGAPLSSVPVDGGSFTDIAGSGFVIEDGDTVAAIGSSPTSGRLVSVVARTGIAAGLISAGSVAGPFTSAVPFIEGADTVSATAAVAMNGAAAIVEAADTLLATGALAIQGSASITEEDDFLSEPLTSATADELGISVVPIASHPISAPILSSVPGAGASIVEDPDVVTATGRIAIAGSATIPEADDTLTAHGGARRMLRSGGSSSAPRIGGRSSSAPRISIKSAA